MKNPFDLFSSRVKGINIPLPQYRFFHHPSSVDSVDPKFMGRDNISGILTDWLTDEKTQSGSYLVTGYRGMGKSSFVGRVLYELTATSKSLLNFLGELLFIILWISIFCSVIYSNRSSIGQGVTNDIPPLPEIIHFVFSYSWVAAILSFVLIICLVCRYHLIGCYRKIRFKSNVICSSGHILKGRYWWNCPSKKEWQHICRVLHNTDISQKSSKRICVSINLGREVMNERDILALLTHELYWKYREFVKSSIANWQRWFLLTSFVMGISSLLFVFIVEKHFDICNELYTYCRISVANSYVRAAILYAVLMAITFLVYYFITPLFKVSQKRSLRLLKQLMERLDAQIEREISMKAGIQGKGKGDVFPIGLLKKKHRITYMTAQVREIEQELIRILDCINKDYFPPKFVFVFDELDKIEGGVQQTGSASSPEYTNEKNFPGGGTSRRRKQNVLFMLANMKLFISTAKAKFIFIAGRELYDAYMADLSDREFSVSSIFNGVINVDSFCTNERREKDIMSNTESFICHQLIPKEFIRQQVTKKYVKALTEKREMERMDINLKLYYQYLISVYNEHMGNTLCEVDDKLTEAERIRNKDMREIIDKTMMLLYHFSVYLYHISNGSPKKMTLYFEEYIESNVNNTDYILHKNEDILKYWTSNPKINIKIKQKPYSLKRRKKGYHLAFGYRDQRNIGFIHYIAYPVTQLIINANQYSDKLLVAASFLTNHIYKHHNNGFSWRNLEHTPELLEVYKIPEFRAFINTIVQNLARTHLIPISCGLYQFKFRKQFAEEISIASKFSEELASLFNFTLDESLTVKQHYMELRDYWTESLKAEKVESYDVKVGLHHILADLHLSDEEYTKAILELQTAVGIIENQMMKHGRATSDENGVAMMLLLMRNMLKLGLAYEKRKTCDSAYAVYTSLVSKLIDYRYFDEKELGLQYAMSKKEEWPHLEPLLFADSWPYNSIPRLDKVVAPMVADSQKKHAGRYYYSEGRDVITDFAHQMTPAKSHIIQRLTTMEDLRLVYQALLAKLFVLEKIEMGGISRVNIEQTESEYIFLHMMTNEKHNFLISVDFFRRMGDILFYKNGLTGDERHSFVEGLYYWAFEARTEILDFCNKHHCYHLKDVFAKAFMEITNDEVKQAYNQQKGINGGNTQYMIKAIESLAVSRLNNMDGIDEDCRNSAISLLKDFMDSVLSIRLQYIPFDSVYGCNVHRQTMWEKNRPIPCYACKYYNRSLRILMKNLFDIQIEQLCYQNKSSKTLEILKVIVERGTSRSRRQNYMIQFGEILDCMGHVMLCCCSKDKILADNITSMISEEFLCAFLHDVKEMEEDSDDVNKVEKLELLQAYSNRTNHKLSTLERSILYYWEASMCFQIGNDLKKAAGSLKKILRVLQNVLKIEEACNAESRKIICGLIYKYLGELKNTVVKQSLVYLYSHYDYININEIQKIKWIFSVQMYESVSLNQLTLFPDVEDIMLLYYDMIRLSVPVIEGSNDRMEAKIKLSGIYKSSTMGYLRLESTIYERILSLRFKAYMNQQIMHHLMIKAGVETQDNVHDMYYAFAHSEKFVKFLGSFVTNKKELMTTLLGEYVDCFTEVIMGDDCKEISEQTKRLHLIEFLIKDSMYCLTRILEIITPYTATTLFTNTFLGEIYQRLFEWNQLFDVLFMVYKVIESDEALPANSDIVLAYACPWKDDETCSFIGKSNRSLNNADVVRESSRKGCPFLLTSCKHKTTPYHDIWNYMSENEPFKCALRNYQEESEDPRIADGYFTYVLGEIGKSNIQYTLSNFSAEMAIKNYRKALEMHHEGDAYKGMISKMYYLDDDLKNDTIQIDSALERFRINCDYIQSNMNKLKSSFRYMALYDIENFSTNRGLSLSLKDRYQMWS